MKPSLRGWLTFAYRWCAYPHRLLPFRSVLKRPGARLLDVGCGNHSPTITKRYFPQCFYEGLDRERWNRDEQDDAAMDAFHEVDLDRPEEIAAIPAGAYDLVLCSHVLEHVRDPWAVIPELARAVKPGGFLYIEVPSERSRRLPAARNGFLGIRGCLNFADDPTHRQLVSLDRAAELLRHAGLGIVRRGKRFLWRRVLLLPLYMAAGLALRGYIPASVMWDLLGFAETLVAQRPQEEISRQDMAGQHPAQHEMARQHPVQHDVAWQHLASELPADTDSVGTPMIAHAPEDTPAASGNDAGIDSRTSHRSQPSAAPIMDSKSADSESMDAGSLREAA